MKLYGTMNEENFNWIDVKDKLPELDSIVLGFDGECVNTMHFNHKGEWFLNEIYAYKLWICVCWMEILEPPEKFHLR